MNMEKKKKTEFLAILYLRPYYEPGLTFVYRQVVRPQCRKGLEAAIYMEE